MKRMKYLKKEEKDKIKKEFYKTKKGKKILPILNRLFFEGIFCLGLAVVILICSFIFELEWWYYCALGALLIAGIMFLVAQWVMRNNEYDKFINYGNKNK